MWRARRTRSPLNKITWAPQLSGERIPVATSLDRFAGAILVGQHQPAAAARVSEFNNAFYQSFLQPWIKMVSGPQVAHAVLELNPLRLGYSLLSDKNLIMRGVAQAANDASAERVPASADNPFLAIQQQFSEAMVYALNLFRDARDEYVERSFHTFYGSPLVQAACGISSNDAPRPRPGLLPSVVAATQAEKRRLRGRMGTCLTPQRGYWSISTGPSIASSSVPSRRCVSCFWRTLKSRPLDLRLPCVISGRS